jgi:hypothetical protein
MKESRICYLQDKKWIKFDDQCRLSINLHRPRTVFLIERLYRNRPGEKVSWVRSTCHWPFDCLKDTNIHRTRTEILIPRRGPRDGEDVSEKRRDGEGGLERNEIVGYIILSELYCWAMKIFGYFFYILDIFTALFFQQHGILFGIVRPGLRRYNDAN